MYCQRSAEQERLVVDVVEFVLLGDGAEDESPFEQREVFAGIVAWPAVEREVCEVRTVAGPLGCLTVRVEL